ncbi:MAG: hypothetical protein SWJ54_11355, partial [Cyanobacteriota bacterium]|nr:hypothetical protein [Cyanobacteriota bacterium]
MKISQIIQKYNSFKSHEFNLNQQYISPQHLLKISILGTAITLGFALPTFAAERVFLSFAS